MEKSIDVLKRDLKYLFFLAASSLFLLAAANPQKSIDLDGDGKPDTIIFKGEPGADKFTIIVNNVRYEGKGDCISGEFSVVDIDSTDGKREITIPEWGPSDDYATTFLRFASGRFIYMGKIPGSGNNLHVNGSGIVHTMVRGSILQTWFFPAAFLPDAKQILRMVKQSLYPMKTPYIAERGFFSFRVGPECTANLSFPLRASPADSTIIAILAPGDKFTIVASDNKRWCVVQTNRGIWGWFEVIRFNIVLPAGIRADVLIDGLCMAD